MRLVMVLLAILGTFLLVIGITTWVGVINNEGVVDAFLKLSFGIAFTILGGIVMLFDLFLLFIFLKRGKKKSL